jgi:molecular chaperone DnaJ
MRGKGIPSVRGGGVGDQLVQVQLITPKKLSKKEKELFEKLAKTNGSINGKAIIEKYRIT